MMMLRRQGSVISPVEEKGWDSRLKRKSPRATAHMSQPQRDRGKKQDLAMGTPDAVGSGMVALATCSPQSLPGRSTCRGVADSSWR